jgi:hypothetical protein
MSNLFKPPAVMPPPTPIKPPPMPDPYGPQAQAAAKLAAEQAAARAGRSSTVLTAASQGQAASGASVPYSGTTLGGGR